MAQVIEIDYAPRDAFMPLHERNERWACVVAHRRAGKTVACVNELIKAALSDKRKGQLYAYVAPFYTQAKGVAWDYLKHFSQPVPGLKVNEAELRIDYPNGNRVQLFGADNADRMRGLAFSGLVADEFGDWKPSVWGYVIRPALADRQGWAIIIGTPKGRNQFYDTYRAAEASKDWFAVTLKASETCLLPASEIEALRRELTEDAFQQEMECDFEAALPGAILGKLISQAQAEGRINDEVTYDRFGSGIEISSDIGFYDTASWWFWQPKVGGFSIIDYDEDNGLDADDWIVRLQERIGTRQLGRIWLPHDARAKTFQSRHTTAERFLEAFGKDKVGVVPVASKIDRINAARRILPRTEFAKTKCADGLDGLRAWQYQFNEDTRTFLKEPRHDWASHPGDGFSYGAQVMSERVPAKKPEDTTVRGVYELPGGGISLGVSLETLWKQQPKRVERV